MQVCLAFCAPSGKMYIWMVLRRQRKGGGASVPEHIAEPIRQAALAYIEQVKTTQGRGGIAKLARAIGVTPAAVSQHIAGGGISPELVEAYTRVLKLDVQETVSDDSDVNTATARFRRLEAVVAFYEDTPRWRNETIKVARLGFVWSDDVPAQEWVYRLDELERACVELREKRPAH